MSDYQCSTCDAVLNAEEDPPVAWEHPCGGAAVLCPECYLDELLQDAEDFFEGDSK
jgi:hypothetical protein